MVSKMNEVGRVSFDENNNEEQRKAKCSQYVERHLELGSTDECGNFLIIPNGGSGDCMFKAVSQAVYEGDESNHREIRKRVVNFILSQKWDKFSESIEVQHINGNSLLQRQWSKDPKEAYKMYMNMAGTLGSSSELTAAGELFHYNFATIQEYCSPTQTTYRVENCVMYQEEGVRFHYFYFTGDYDNGHWEYIKNLSEQKLADGTYKGRHRIVINGDEISFEDWLRRETENNNEAEQLKIATNHAQFIKRRTSHPFELKGFHYCRDGTVRLNGKSFTIAPVQHTDLFSVLAHECLKNEASAHDIELILIKHRYAYFEDINYKLITQPWSHNFTINAIRYCGQSLKGNIQDLIGAADLYSFSFILFIKMSDGEDTHQCKFTHVDRWGGESDRILYFFMRLSRYGSEDSEQLIAKWWRLNPVDGNSPTASDAKLFCRKSISRTDGNANKMLDMNSMRKSASYVKGRPLTADAYGTQSQKPSRMSTRPSSVQGYGEVRGVTAPAYDFNTAQDILQGTMLAQAEPKYQVLEGGITVTRISDSDDHLKTDDCLQKDHAKLFGPRPASRKSSALDTKPDWLKNKTRLVKKNSLNNSKKEKVKPATGRDLLKHPEKVKTMVKLKDGKSAGRELTFRGSGYMKSDDVLTDLQRQGLIRMPAWRTGHLLGIREKQRELSIQQILAANAALLQKGFNDALGVRDENFNVIYNQKQIEGSDVSYEDFATPVLGPQAAANLHDALVTDQISQGQRFPVSELLPPNRGIHKVSPNPMEAQYPPSYYPRDVHNDNQKSHRSCTDRMLHVLGRLAEGFRNFRRSVRKGLIRRYYGLKHG